MQTLTNNQIKTLIDTLQSKGYKVYQKPYQLNIVGQRNKSTTPNKFDDKINVFYKDDVGNWVGVKYPATTDAGTYYLKNPIHKDLGTSLLKGGQYVDSYKLGLHKGQYEALVQSKPVTTIVDYNRDNILDFTSSKEKTGLFGINIHKAGSGNNTIDVNKWSAGCQVIQDENDFKDLISKSKKHEKLYGNSFTYTLIDDREYNRSLLRRFLFFISLGTLIFVGYKIYSKKSIIK